MFKSDFGTQAKKPALDPLDLLIQYTITQQVNCLAITTDKQHLSVGGNKVVKIYEVPSLNANPVMVFDGHEGNVTSVGFQNESKWMYTGSEDTTIRIWDLRAKGFQRLFEASAPINSMVLAQNQVDLYSADQNGVIRVWDLTKSACKQHIVYVKIGCSR